MRSNQLNQELDVRNRPARAAAALLLALTATSTSGLVHAQEAAASSDAAEGPLQEIVVTATRHEESLSKVPISVTALTQEALDIRGIKDFQDVAKFTPGVNIDNSGTNNISIRGIASSGGAGTTGIYIDDTPIQMRALAFNPDDTLPKTFDVDRVEVLRGPQGTLFGAGSEGGTVRYITTQPSLTKTTTYARGELSFTQGGEPSYEAGVAVGGPLIDGTLGARASVWFRHDGGYIDRINPVTRGLEDKNANYDRTVLVRLAAVWAPSQNWTITPGIYYQDRYRNDAENYWPFYSNPGKDKFVSGNPTQRFNPDKFYLPSLKVEGDLGSMRLISNTSYYHRQNTTGYDGTLYNLGFYQSTSSNNLALPVGSLLLDGTGIHLPAGLENYRSPASVDNGQQNFTQELRLQSANQNARVTWTTGIFYSANRQSYLEQIADPMLQNFLQVMYPIIARAPPASGDYVTDFFSVGFDPNYPTDSYFLHTNAKDTQLAWFGEATWSATDTFKATVGARYAQSKFANETLTGGPQLFLANQAVSISHTDNSFTPKLSLAYQHDPKNLFYATYAKGFRPGGANNPVPAVACAGDFAAFGITQSPLTFDSDTVNSFELGTKNNFNNRVKIATSVYYIKWNNIQQTVVPPVCQISFIANLGQATAKGADVQADVAIGEHVTMELTAGYTEARYTQDSKLSPTETKGVVQSGDAIVGHSGQPGAPFTTSIGFEYHFTAFAREAFVRADYEYEGESKWPSPAQDPNSLQHDAASFTLPATNFITMRSGVTVGAWQVAAFIDNLTDSHTLTNYDFSINPGVPQVNPGDPQATRLMRAYTFRPRTFGLSFTYRR